MKTLMVLAATLVAAVSLRATDIAVEEGGETSFDLQGSDNAAANRVVFNGSGTLKLTGAAADFLPQIVASEGITATVAAEAETAVRFKNHVSVKGTLALSNVTAAFGDTTMTPAVVDAALSVVAAFPMLDVAALAEGTSITVDGAAQITKKVEGLSFASTAFVALAGENALGELDEYELDDCDFLIVNINAFKAESAVKVAAGRTLGFYTATVGADFGWTEQGDDTLACDIVLGGTNETTKAVSRLALWSTKPATHTFSGAISGIGDVESRPMVNTGTLTAGPSITYNMYAKPQTFQGLLREWKATGQAFNMRVPAGGVVPYLVELVNICTITFFNVEGENAVVVPSFRSGYYNTTLNIRANQTVTVQELNGVGGFNVTGQGSSSSTFVLEKNLTPQNILRMVGVTFVLDEATLAATPYYFVENTGGNKGRIWFRKGANGTLDKTVPAGCDAVVCAGRTVTGNFSTLPAGATLTIGKGADVTFSKAAAGSSIVVEGDAVARLSEIDAGAQIDAQAGAKVILSAGDGAVPVALHNATLEYVGDASGWEDLVGLWVDASKTETLKPLTNATGAVQYQSRSKNAAYGNTTNMAAQAWWYDWRDTQKTYYLYNDRCYQTGSYCGSGIEYVNPWLQPDGVADGKPCVHFGPMEGNIDTVEGHAPWNGTMARLDLHAFANKPSTTCSMEAKYVVLVYGAQAGGSMHNGASLYYNAADKIYRDPHKIDMYRDDSTVPMNSVGSGLPLRVNGEGGKNINTECFKEGWQILAIDTSNGEGNFSGLGKGYGAKIGGGQKYAEVLVFSQKPNVFQVAAVEKYLSEKWGISLAGSDDSSKIVSAATGFGVIKVGKGVSLEVGADFNGTFEMAGGKVSYPTDGDPMPTVKDVPTENQIAWFDPSVEETIRLANVTDESRKLEQFVGSEQTNEVVWLHDRVVARRTQPGALVFADSNNPEYIVKGGNRRTHLTPMALGSGKVMNWLDANEQYREYDNDGKPYQWGNAFRFYAVSSDGTGVTTSDHAADFATCFIVQDSRNGGGSPLGNAFSMAAGYQRKTTSPTAALWKSGVSANLTGGEVYVNGKKVADPMTSAEFTGGPEVLTFNTKPDTTFPLKAIGDYNDSQEGNARAALYGETIFYGAALSENERKTVEAYLAWKWFGQKLHGYFAATGYTIAGKTDVSFAQAKLPNFADGFTGTVEVTDEDGLSFELDSAVSTARAATGYFDVKGGALTVKSAVVRVTTQQERAKLGRYKLIGWDSKPDIAFTLDDAAESALKRPLALVSEDDGLYLDVTGYGLMFLLK